MAKIGQRRVAIFLLNGWQVRLVDVWRCALALEREHTFIIHNNDNQGDMERTETFSHSHGI